MRFLLGSVAVVVLTVLNLLSVDARLIQEQLAAYKKILGTDKITSEGLIKLLTLHDSDTVCVGACRRFV